MTKSTATFTGKISSERDMRVASADKVKVQLTPYSAGITRKLSLKVIGVVLPITLLLFFILYGLATSEIEKLGRTALANETEILFSPYKIDLSDKAYEPDNQTPTFGMNPNSAFFHLFDTLIANNKLSPEEKHILLSKSGQKIEVPAWLKHASAHINTELDSDIKSVADENLSATPRAISGLVRLDGVDYIAIGMILVPTHWKYIRLIPQDKILGPIKHIFLLLTAAFLILGCIAVWIFEISFRRLVLSRLQSLLEAVKRIGTGDPNIRVEFSGSDEISNMANAFNHMADNFEGHRNIESILNQLEHDYLDGKKTKVLLDDVCRELAKITGFPLVWVALQRDENLSLHGAGGSSALEFRASEEHALAFCAEALKKRLQSCSHKGESPFSGAPTGQTAIFPLAIKQETAGAIIFHAPCKTGFVGEHWNAMRYWSGRLQHALHVMQNEKEMLDVRLRMLQAQIEPHFLVNTLSNIITQVKHNPSVAKHMLSLLARYLRVSLTRTRGQRTTLKEELEVLSVYLEIQSFRMPGRLTHNISCPEAFNDLRFPPLLLQPLVENAVQHGIEPAIEGGKVNVEIYQTGEKLILKVTDSGRGLLTSNKKNHPHRGVGITNIRSRLLGLYGQSANLKITQNEPTGVTAIMEIPLKLMESI